MIGAAEDTAQTGRKGFPCSGPSLAVAPSEEGVTKEVNGEALRSSWSAEVPAGFARMGR